MFERLVDAVVNEGWGGLLMMGRDSIGKSPPLMATSRSLGVIL
jgi:hypothetical protein